MSESNQKRRWLRYSLRSLLVAVTIFCIWLGLRVRQAQRRHEAVAAIWATHAAISFDYQWVPGESGPNPDGQPSAPAWLRGLFGDDFFRYPALVWLKGDAVPDEFLGQYADVLSEVHVLGISSDNVTDKSLAIVAKISQLQFLELNCPNFTSAGLRQLVPLKRLKGLSSYKDSGNESIALQLDTRGNFDCPGNPLDEAAECLSMQFGVPVHWDQERNFQVRSSPSR